MKSLPIIDLIDEIGKPSYHILEGLVPNPLCPASGVHSKASVTYSLLTLLFDTISATSWVSISFLMLKEVRQIMSLPLTSLINTSNIMKTQSSYPW